MKLGLFIPFWNNSPERWRLSCLVAHHYERLMIPGMQRIAIISPGDPYFNSMVRWQDEDHGYAPWFVAVKDNKPLSNKFNYGFSLCRDMDLDAAMLVGSDDLITARYIQDALSLLGQGANAVMASGLWFYDLCRGKGFFTNTSNAGPGSVYSMDLLRRVGCEVFVPERDKGVDARRATLLGAADIVRTSRVTMDEERSAVIIDLKTLAGERHNPHSANIWSYSHMAAAFSRTATEICCPKKFFTRHFPVVADEVIKWKWT